MSCWTEKFNLKYIKSKIYTSINQGLPFVYNYSLDIVSVFVDVEDVVDSNMKYDFTTNVRVYLNPLFKMIKEPTQGLVRCERFCAMTQKELLSSIKEFGKVYVDAFWNGIELSELAFQVLNEDKISDLSNKIKLSTDMCNRDLLDLWFEWADQRESVSPSISDLNFLVNEYDPFLYELREYVENFGYLPKKGYLGAQYEYAKFTWREWPPEYQVTFNNIREKVYSKHIYEILEEVEYFCKEHNRWYIDGEDTQNNMWWLSRYLEQGRVSKDIEMRVTELYYKYIKKYSSGEKQVSQCLVKMGIKFYNQFRIDECRNKCPLPFDIGFYINDQLCLIEYQGQQHYEPVDLFGGEQNLRYTQHNDAIKYDYCKEHEIPLLRIPYWEKKNIDKLVSDFIFGVEMKGVSA